MTTIVEVGAHQGAETLNFLTDSDALVFAFEPEHSLFVELFKKSQQYPRLTVLPFAVSICDNQEALFHKENGLSTVVPPLFGEQTGGAFSMVWSIRLDTFCDLYNIRNIDYLRIDAPFNEENCLESLGSRIACVVRGRIRQYGAPSVIPAWLLDHGFSIEEDTTSNNITEPDIKFFRS